MGAAASCSPIRKDDTLNQDIPSFKIVLVGDPEVGKTSIFLRYIKNQFDYSYQPTMQVSIGNLVRKVNIPCEALVSVTMWDLPGREEMDLRKSYYKDISAAVVVVDMSDHDSITMAGTWKQDILNNAITSNEDKNYAAMGPQAETRLDPKKIPILLLGNKSDKLPPHDEDSEEILPMVKELDRTAQQHGFVGSALVSAKESEGSVHAAIQSLVRYLLKRDLSDKMGNKKGLKSLFSSSPGSKQVSDPSSSHSDPEKGDFMPLISTGLTEFDELFEECNKPVETVEKVSSLLTEGQTNFKRACSVAGVTSSAKCSLEECIGGLKELVRTEKDDDGIEALEDGGFLKLVITEEAVDVPGPVRRVLKTFHEELASASKMVLSQLPGAKISLEETMKKIDSLSEELWDICTTHSRSERGAKAIEANVLANTLRVKEAIDSATESLQSVDDDYKKIKAAMLW